MSGRFPLYTDTDIDGPVGKALRAAAWDWWPRSHYAVMSPGDFKPKH